MARRKQIVGAHVAPERPPADARSWFAGKPEAIENNAELGSALQAGYFILAARALGLACGPMGGFGRQKTDETFFLDLSSPPSGGLRGSCLGLSLSLGADFVSAERGAAIPHG